MANSRNWLQQLKDNLNKVTREFGGMKNNVKNTNVICVNLLYSRRLLVMMTS